MRFNFRDTIHDKYLDLIQCEVSSFCVCVCVCVCFGKNYTILIEIILIAMSILYKIKPSHGISQTIYLHRRPIRAIKTSKIYITKPTKESCNGKCT